MSVTTATPYNLCNFNLTVAARAVAPATTVSMTVHGYQSSGNVIGAVNTGDTLVLVHAADTGANLAAYTTPNTIGNPWTLIDSIDYGSGGPKLRVYQKVATAAEALADSVYSVTGPAGSYQWLRAYIIRAGLVETGAPVATAKTTGINAPSSQKHPALAIPSGYATVGNIREGLAMGVVFSGCRSASNWNPTGYSTLPDPPWVTDFGPYAQDSGGVNGLTGEVEFAQVVLDHTQTVPAHGYSAGTAPGGPWVGMTLLFLPFADYAAPVGAISSITDTFPGPGIDTSKSYVGSGAPTVSGGALVLHGGDSVVYGGPHSLKDSGVVVEVRNAAVSTKGQVQLMLRSADFPTFNQAYMLIGVNASSQTVITIGITDNGQSTGAYDLVRYDPIKHRWWRIRESQGVLIFDVSPEGTSWLTLAEMEVAAADPITGAALQLSGHGLLDDQLGDMTIQLVAASGGTGDPSTATATFANLNNPPAQPTVATPTQRTLDWMGVSTALQPTYHGRDVLMGICDQGSTPGVRSAHSLTLVNRNYLVPDPRPRYNQDIYPGQNHGCLVTSDGVPPGGKFVEAVISSDGSSSSSTMMAGILWCAQQGAKVINLSYGGGGSAAIYGTTFDNIKANYDCQVFISAGNDYAEGIDYPAYEQLAYPTIVHAVAAFDEVTDARAPFSNYSYEMSGVAPGADINGLTPGGDPQQWNGTSGASPHGASILARALTGNTRSPTTLGAYLNNSARPLPAPANDQGGGAFDLSHLAAAIASGVPPVPGAAVPPYPGLPVFVDGMTALVSPMNALSENIGNLYRYTQGGIRVGKPLCVVRRLADPATTGGVPSGSTSGTLMPWDTVYADTDNMFVMEENGQITFLTDGVYRIALQIHMDATPGGIRLCELFMNGTSAANVAGFDARNPVTADEGTVLFCTTIVEAIAGSAIAGGVVQDSGSTLLLVVNYGGSFMSAEWIAPLET